MINSMSVAIYGMIGMAIFIATVYLLKVLVEDRKPNANAQYNKCDFCNHLVVRISVLESELQRLKVAGIQSTPAFSEYLTPELYAPAEGMTSWHTHEGSRAIRLLQREPQAQVMSAADLTQEVTSDR